MIEVTFKYSEEEIVIHNDRLAMKVLTSEYERNERQEFEMSMLYGLRWWIPEHVKKYEWHLNNPDPYFERVKDRDLGIKIPPHIQKIIDDEARKYTDNVEEYTYIYLSKELNV